MVNSSKPVTSAALVLGMHRSGTSCFTRCLNILGYSIPNTLIGSDHSNKTGHWESRKVARLNDSFLEKIGLTWSSWSIANLDLLKSEDLKHFQADIQSVLKSEFPRATNIVVKEPRICRATGIYLKSLDDLNYDTKVFFVFRNPLEVVDSLKNRNDIPKSDGALLWLRYNLDAEYASRNSKRAFSTYSNLITSPVDMFTSIAGMFSMSYPQSLDDVSKRLVDFVKPSEKNHAYTDEDVSHNDLTKGWIEDVYSALLTLCNNPNSKGAFSILDRIRTEFDIASPNILKIVNARQFAHESKLEEKETALKQSNEMLEEKTRHALTLEKDLHESQKEIANSNIRNEILVADKEGTEASLAERALSLEGLEQELGSARKALEASNIRNEILVADKEGTEASLAERALSLEGLEQELGSARKALEASNIRNEILVADKEGTEASLAERALSLEGLEQELGSARKALEASNIRNEILVADKEGTEASLAERALSLEGLEQELGAAHKALDVSNSQIKVYNDELNALKILIEEQEENLKTTLSTQRRKRKRLKKSFNKSQKTLHKANSETLNLEETLSNLQTKHELMTTKYKQQIEAANEKLDQAVGERSQLQGSLALKGKEYVELKSEAEALEAHLFDMTEKYKSLERKYDVKIKIVNEMDKEREKIGKQSKELRRIKRDLQKDKWNLQDQVRFYKDQVDAYRHSTSWRITAPIRKIKIVLKKIKHGQFNIKKPSSRISLNSNIESIPQDKFLPATSDHKSEYTDGNGLELIKRSGLFDVGYYKSQYSDSITGAVDPIEYYYLHGWKEGHQPSASFNSLAYIAANPEIKGHDICPLSHFLYQNNELVENFKAPLIDKREFGKIVVFTASAGGYDDLKPPLKISKNADYVYFSENKVSDLLVWKHKPFDYFDVEPSRMARYIKTHAHVYFGDYDWAIWVDANIQLDCMPEDIIRDHIDNHNFVLFSHPYRSCIYKEAQECIKREKDTSNLLSEQINRYKTLNFPAGAGLYETGVMISKPKDASIQKLMNIWWREILMGSKRDQVALPFALKEANVNVGQMAAKGICVRTDPRFIYFRHK